METKSTSGAFSFCRGDAQRIITNFVMYNVPLFLLTVLTAINQGASVKSALLTASITLLSAVVDAGRKFATDNTGGERL